MTTLQKHYAIHALSLLLILWLLSIVLKKPKEIINPINNELKLKAVRLQNELDSIRILAEDYRAANDSLEAAKPKVEYKYITRNNEIIDYSNSDAIKSLRDEIAGYEPR
jgi:hypothetical protein